MIELSAAITEQIVEHVKAEYPREACGVVIVFKGKYKYVPCRNVAESNEHFVIHAEDLANAEDLGTLAMVVHSHPNIPAHPSQADLISCERTGVPWLIVNWPLGTFYQFEPTGYKAPLVGRQFLHGVLDCFTLVRDYYKERLSIELSDFYRADEWWLKSQNLYLDNADSQNFIRVETPQTHDVLLMQVASPVPNHAAIWLGDGTIFHHQTGRLSSIDVYGGWYQKITTHIFRHKSLM